MTSLLFSIDAIIEFSEISYSGAEGESVTLIITLSAVTSQAVTVQLNTMDDSAFGKKNCIIDMSSI